MPLSKARLCSVLLALSAWAVPALAADVTLVATPSPAQQGSGVPQFCADVTAVQWESATPTVGQSTVDIAATVIQVDRDGTTLGTSAVIETRLMRQDPEGRWLVDVKVQAG